MAAVDYPYSGMMYFSSQVSDSRVPNVDSTACKLGDSNSDISDTVSLVSHFSMPRPVSAPPYTSLYKMNICSTSVLNAPHVAVQQVMNSDAVLYSVIIPETHSSKSHFLLFVRKELYHQSSSHGQLRSHLLVHQPQICQQASHDKNP